MATLLSKAKVILCTPFPLIPGFAPVYIGSAVIIHNHIIEVKNRILQPEADIAHLGLKPQDPLFGIRSRHNSLR